MFVFSLLTLAKMTEVVVTSGVHDSTHREAMLGQDKARVVVVY